MSKTLGFAPLTPFHRKKKETGESQVEVILIRGLEDLPKNVVNTIGKVLNVRVFNPRWRTYEDLDKKTKRLDLIVQKAIDEGKQPVVIGLSAGAAMMETYMLKYHHKIRHGYSVSGLLNPNLNSKDPDFRESMDKLTKNSPGFKQVAEFLTENLTLEVIETLHLPEKISAYSSPNDTVVPQSASHPRWIKNFHNVGKGDHLESIIRALIPDIISQVRDLKQNAKFD